MKVGNITEVVGPELPRHREDAVQRTVTPVSKTAEESDKLELSQSDKLGAVAAGQEVRAEMVASTKAAIDGGAFMIDPNQVANRIIHETASLLEVLSGMSATETSDPHTANKDAGSTQNSQEKFGAGSANERKAGPDR